ncbi:putative bZIP transcription factor AP-1/Yap1 [Aspergillus candidus]|uniref:PAP1-domain-containing protein n=1 Tax=Aspergillus candidus TaxID=41067 RepID=A0A2I2FGB6_ASPCN|nr:PAP1-domain-containing protein [Aspergillus candidus]PLB39672.1 PAP1-domain-containing protein [Aspergillus candidus]
MTDHNALYQQGLYLTPDQQDLLLAALSSNKGPSQRPENKSSSKESPPAHHPQLKPDPDATPARHSLDSFTMSPGFDRSALSGGLDESPFLDFPNDPEFDFHDDSLIGDLPGSLPPDEVESGEKRKDLSDDEAEESGKKRRESEGARKPGRKPLTSEPTSKRKAQNRAAQRAFRERKEKHLKDLETKVEELQKASENANQENGLLRAQVERLNVELREYRKRLSVAASSGNGLLAMSSATNAPSRGLQGLNNSEFLFDFPKFGDLPSTHLFNNGPWAKAAPQPHKDQEASRRNANVPGVVSRQSPTGRSPTAPSSAGTTPASASAPAKPPARSARDSKPPHVIDLSNSDSPSSSSDSHQSHLLSSSGTSPEPNTHSPAAKAPGHHEACTYHSINGEESFCAQLGLACGNIRNPIPAVRSNSESATNTPAQGTSEPPSAHHWTEPADPSADQTPGLDWMAQQNGGQFDPVLFGDWREPQDSILSQDFGTFFDDAFPLPDLGSPSHNFSELGPGNQTAPKKGLLAQIDSRLEEDEVVPGEDKAQMLSCTKIWDRLQSMERFRNGEIDVDNLCSELRNKARCSEGGVVVNQQDVEDIMGRAK